MNKLYFLAALLTVAGVASLTWVNTEVSWLEPIQLLSQSADPLGAAGNGLFMLIAVFWIGTVDAIRRQLEPKKLDWVVRFAVLAFAVSYLIRLLFPVSFADIYAAGMGDRVHAAVALALYAGPAVFAVRLGFLTQRRPVQLSAVALLMTTLALSLWVGFNWNGVGIWQRGYEFLFSLLFGFWFFDLQKTQRS